MFLISNNTNCKYLLPLNLNNNHLNLNKFLLILLKISINIFLDNKIIQTIFMVCLSLFKKIILMI